MAFEIIPHTADVRLLLTADSFAGLFRDGVLGLMRIVGGKGKGELVERKIEISANDRTSLLVDFLNEVLTTLQINREIYETVEIENLGEKKVMARLSGHKIDRFTTDVKAVTYHLAEVKNENGQWSISLVLDV